MPLLWMVVGMKYFTRWGGERKSQLGERKGEELLEDLIT